MIGLGRCGTCMYTHTHTHNGILLIHKKEQNNAICSNLDGTRDSHTKWSKYDKYHINTTYIWNLIYGTNEPFHRKENHGLGEQTSGCLEGEGGSERDWECRVIGCKLLLLVWIYNEILLCITGNYVQSLMMEHVNVRKKTVYMYV